MVKGGTNYEEFNKNVKTNKSINIRQHVVKTASLLCIKAFPDNTLRTY